MIGQVIRVKGTSFDYSDSLTDRLEGLAGRVRDMRARGALSGEVLRRIQRFFRIRHIYNSNAIEGNLLNIGETRLVVEQGLTLSGRSLRDQVEAKNLSEALDFLEELASNPESEIGETHIRQIHSLILSGIDDSGAGRYRTQQVQISGSNILPTQPESIAPEMAAFSQWFRSVSLPTSYSSDVNPVVIAAAAHAWFVQIHPFIDGNGRTARILMNLILMRYGFPIGIITREDRQRYYDALEESEGGDLTPLIGLIAESVEESLEEWERAAQEQREFQEWTESIAQRLAEPQRTEAANKYEVWKNAMELLKSYFRQAVVGVNQQSLGMANAFFKDFGIIEFEKYLTLRQGISAKRTWFFRIDVRRDSNSARYLFFFGYPSAMLRGKVDVTLHLAREEPEGSFNYVVLPEINRPNVPDIVEIGYLPEDEKLIKRCLTGSVSEISMDATVREFFESIVRFHFSHS